MTTLSHSSGFSMANTAALQLWGAEWNGWVASLGLVQTSDSGQVNWSTVTMPATSSIIGYEIWRFADSSIYFKIEWFTGGSLTNCPVVWLTVGTGSNGSGTITGQATPRFQIAPTSNSLSAGPFLTYGCCTADFFGIAHKIGADSSQPSIAAFTIEKTVDSSGTATATGYCVSYQGGSLTANMNKIVVRTASPAATSLTTASFCAVPGNLTNSSNAAGNKQIFIHQFAVPDVVISKFLCTAVASELPAGTSFTATLVGSTPHTYMSLGSAIGTGNSSSAAATWSPCMLWE